MKCSSLCLNLILGLLPLATVAKAQTERRVVVEDKGFSIMPPEGWEVSNSLPDLTLFMQVPKDAETPYRRSLQVRYSHDSKVIDDLEGKQFKDVLKERRGNALRVARYEVDDPVLVKLANGQPAILYYAYFTLDQTELMEMHLLMGSEEGHFLLTYTDRASAFQARGPGTPLDRVYRSMLSAEVTSPSGSRFEFATKAGLTLLVLLILGWAFRFYQGRKSIQFQEDEIPDEEEVPLSAAHATEEIVKAQAKAHSEEREIHALDEGHEPEDQWNLDRDDDRYDQAG